MSGENEAQALQRLLAARVRQGRIPGACWHVEGGGIVQQGALGLAQLAPAREPTRVEAPYDLASLTKPLSTALLLVLLEQEGQLDLDAPAREVLCELDGSPYADASAADLARHVAGLPAWAPLYTEAADLDGYVARIAARPRATEVGRALYSDLGYILLGALLERTTGRGLDRLFDERIATPCGLARAGFATSPSTFADAAATECGNGYERALAGVAGERFAWREHVLRGEVHDANAHGLGGVAGHAGLFGPVGDVVRLGRELLEPRHLGLQSRARRRLLGEAVDGRTVGFEMAQSSSATRGILPAAAPGHTGFTGTSLWLDPGHGRLYVLLSNRVHPRVDGADFQPVRRAFHRLGQRVLEAG